MNKNSSVIDSKLLFSGDDYSRFREKRSELETSTYCVPIDFSSLYSIQVFYYVGKGHTKDNELGLILKDQNDERIFFTDNVIPKEIMTNISTQAIAYVFKVTQNMGDLGIYFFVEKDSLDILSKRIAYVHKSKGSTTTLSIKTLREAGREGARSLYQELKELGEYNVLYRRDEAAPGVNLFVNLLMTEPKSGSILKMTDNLKRLLSLDKWIIKQRFTRIQFSSFEKNHIRVCVNLYASDMEDTSILIVLGLVKGESIRPITLEKLKLSSDINKIKKLVEEFETKLEKLYESDPMCYLDWITKKPKISRALGKDRIAKIENNIGKNEIPFSEFVDLITEIPVMYRLKTDILNRQVSEELGLIFKEITV